jgi:hypothetical protein
MALHYTTVASRNAIPADTKRDIHIRIRIQTIDQPPVRFA